MTLTHQEAYNKALHGVLAQQSLAKAEGYGCLYLQPHTGFKCGVGHLLVDDQMRSRWDENAWTASYLQVEEDDLPGELLEDMEQAGIIDLDNQFLVELQSAHDEAYDLTDFLAYMRALALNWDLQP